MTNTWFNQNIASLGFMIEEQGCLWYSIIYYYYLGVRMYNVYIFLPHCLYSKKNKYIEKTWVCSKPLERDEYFIGKISVLYFIEPPLITTPTVVWTKMETTFRQMPTTCTSSSIIRMIKLVWTLLMKRSTQARINCIITIQQVYHIQINILHLVDMGNNLVNSSLITETVLIIF